MTRKVILGAFLKKILKITGGGGLLILTTTLLRCTFLTSSGRKCNDDEKSFSLHISLRLHNKLKKNTIISILELSMYLDSHREGGERRVEPERRGERQHFTKLGRKYQHACISSL
jgi:hypothetical protein